MSEWNLSVRLTGQGSGLARTLRDTARDARAASRDVDTLRRDIDRLRASSRNKIRIRLDVDAGHLRSDVRAALNSAGAGQGLQVRLGIDAGHLRTDVRTALSSAGAGQGLQVRLGVDAHHLRTDVRAALSSAGAGQGMAVNLRLANAMQLRREVSDAVRWASMGQGLQVRLGIDADHLRSDVNAALTAAGSGQGLRVDLQLGNPMQLRRDVQNAVRWAAQGHRITIPIGLDDPMQLRRDVSAAVRWASMNQTITIRVTPDTSALTTLGGSHGGGGGDSGNDLGLNGLLPIATAAIPLIAGLSTSIAPLAGQFAAAGVAGAAFGIALAGQIEPLSAAADAEKKYQDAVVQHGRTSKEAMEASLAYQQQLAQLPPATQKTAVALSILKDDFAAWSADMSEFTMTPVTRGIAVLDKIIPHLTPEVTAASAQLNRLVTIAGGAVDTPGFDALSDKFAAFTSSQLRDLTDQVIHFMRVLSEGHVASGPISEFMDYARQNGPAAREAVSAISAAVVTLLRGAAEAGPSMLTLVTAVARLVSALPPELVGIILHVATALKLLQLSGAGMAALAGGLARVRTQIMALSAASAAAGGGLGGLRAAFMSLGVAARTAVTVAGIGALLLVLSSLSNIGKTAPPDVDKLTTSLGNLGKTGKASGEAARAFGKDFGGLADSLRTLSRPSNMDKTQQWMTKLVGMDSTPVKEAKENLDAVDKSLASLVQGGKGDIAAAAFDHIAAAMRKQGMSGKELRAQLDNYKSALADQKFEQELAAESMGIFGQAAQDTQAKLEAQKQSADGLRQSLQALADVNRAGAGAMNAFEQSIDDASKAAKDNAGSLKMQHGELDLNGEKARTAETALRNLGASTNDAAAKAREQGKSWEYVNGIYKRGEDTFVSTAQKMGLTRVQAEALARSYINIPDKKSTQLEMRTEDAKADLLAFGRALADTPNAKSVTLSTLSKSAEQVLENFGYKVTRLPDGSVTITAAGGQALGTLSSVASMMSSLNGRHAATYVTTYKVTKFSTVGAPGSSVPVAKRDYAHGGIADYYASGGIRPGQIQHFAAGSDPGDKPNQHRAQIAPAGSYRVWGERETDGEGYVPFRRAARPRSRRITEEIVRRLGGDPRDIQWNADGNVTDWRYDPQTGSLFSSSDAGQAGHKTRKVKVKGKGGKVTIKEIEYFDLSAVEKRIKSTARATQAWNKDLGKVADRVGGDVAEALAAMGEDGRKLADKMAHGSTKYINDMAKALRNLQKTAKASLTDYTRQLGKANGANKAFSDDLAKLAAMGYGDLAAQLAAQGDEAAQQLADSASKDKGKAKKANEQAKKANNSLTADQVTELVQIIAAIKSSKTGIHDVAAATSLGEDEIIAVGNKAKSQIHKSLGSRATKFLADLGRANKHLSYADGGIRAGMYATRGGIVRFAEPETHGEAYLPLSPSKRRSALPVLADVAHRFGVGLTDASAGRPVVIVHGGGDTHVSVTPVRTGATASDIGAQVGRSVRRARRGGVNARATA